MSTWKLILVLAVLFPSPSDAKKEDKQFDVGRYSDSVFVLTGNDYGTNIGVIASEKGLLLIDPMPGEESLDDLRFLINGISELPVSHIVNTHNHEDHTGGNGYFGNSGAAILGQSDLHSKSGPGSENLILSGIYGLELISVGSHTNQDRMYFHPDSNALFVCSKGPLLALCDPLGSRSRSNIYWFYVGGLGLSQLWRDAGFHLGTYSGDLFLGFRRSIRGPTR